MVIRNADARSTRVHCAVARAQCDELSLQAGWKLQYLPEMFEPTYIMKINSMSAREQENQ